MRTHKVWATAACLWALAGAVQAAPVALQGRDINGNAVGANDASAVFEYDANLNLTWLRDWNYARTIMDWATAVNWASTLTVGAFSGWALPTIDAGDTSCSNSQTPVGFPTQHYGYHCTGSPMVYLYNTEQMLGPSGPFLNVNGNYWSATEYEPNPSNAWSFEAAGSGRQMPIAAKTNSLFAVAVRSGDVANKVPEPASLALMGIALAGLAATRRRKQ